MRQKTRLLQILFLALMFALLAAWSWRKTADILIDFGVQLYVPWQLAEGKVLYRDVAYLPGGPASQYFNALCFKVFGTSFTTIILVNLALTASLVAGLFRFFEKAADTFTATAITFLIISVFAFAELAPGGNYNYITPYSHEAFHALFLSVFAVFLLARSISHQRSLPAIAAGLCIGLTFLMKPETFLAIAITALVAWVVAWRGKAEMKQLFKPLVSFIIGTLVPPLICFSYFLNVLSSSSEALQSMAWAWVPLLTTDAANNKYYVWCLGLDHPIGNSFIALMQCASMAIAIALLAWCSQQQRKRYHHLFTGIIVVILIGAIWQTHIREAARFLLFLTPIISAILIWRWWKSAEDKPSTGIILWSVFSTVMLAKLGFFSKIWHYGTFLAMPATSLAVYFVFGFLPRVLMQWNVRPALFRAVCSILLLTIAAKAWHESNGTYSLKNRIAGHGPDQIRFYEKYYDPTGTLMNEAFEWMKKHTPNDATLAVLPHGVMLNFLLRRDNPTAYTTFILPEWQAYGEDNILKAYDANRPDYIAITRFDVSSGFEYGVGQFGETPTYGLKTMQWIQNHYTPVKLIRYRTGDPFGIDILKLNPKSNRE